MIFQLLFIGILNRTKTKSLINKIALNNKANLAIAAASCASSPPEIINKPKKKKILRKAGGKVWNDPTMNQWLSGKYGMLFFFYSNKVKLCLFTVNNN